MYKEELVKRVENARVNAANANSAVQALKQQVERLAVLLNQQQFLIAQLDGRIEELENMLRR